MTSNRLALLVNADGTRWVTEFREGDIPKRVMRGGRSFECIMTMDMKHIEWANDWLFNSPNGHCVVSLAPNAPRLNIVA
jgi:hypothetical protein